MSSWPRVHVNGRLESAEMEWLHSNGAGAYAMSMSSNYNTRGRAAEVLVSGDQAWLVRERESTADQIRGEHLLPES